MDAWSGRSAAAAEKVDVVRLDSGEVVERKGELRARNGAQIALEAVLHVHAGLGRPFGDDVHDLRKLHKRLNDRFRLFGGHEEVQIVHGLFSAPKAAADLHA